MQEPTAPDARPQWPNGANGDARDAAPSPASVWPPIQLWEGGNTAPVEGAAGEDPGNAGRRHLSELFRRRSDGGIAGSEAADESTSPNLMRPPQPGPHRPAPGSAPAPQPPAAPGPSGGLQPMGHPQAAAQPGPGESGPAPDHRPPPAEAYGYTEAPTGEFPRWGTGLVPQTEPPAPKPPPPPPGPPARPAGPHSAEPMTDRTLPRMDRKPPASPPGTAPPGTAPSGIAPPDESRAPAGPPQRRADRGHAAPGEPGERNGRMSRLIPPGLLPPDRAPASGEQPTGALPAVGGPPSPQPTEPPRRVAQGRVAVPPPSRNGHLAAPGPAGAAPGVNGAPRETADPRENAAPREIGGTREVGRPGVADGPGPHAPDSSRGQTRARPAADPASAPAAEPAAGPVAEPTPPRRGFADPLSDPLPDDALAPPHVAQPQAVQPATTPPAAQPQEPQRAAPQNAGADALLSGPAMSWSDLMRQDAEAASGPAPTPEDPRDHVVPRQFAGAPRPLPPQAEATAETPDQPAPGPEQAPGPELAPGPEPAAPGESGDADAEFIATAAIYEPGAEPPYQPDPDTVLTAVRELPGVRDAELVGEPGQQQVLRLDLVGSVDPHVVGRQAAELLRDRLGLHAAVRARSQRVSEPPRTPGEESPRDGGRRSRREGDKPFNPFGEVAGLPVSVEQVQVVTAGLEAAVEVGLAIGGVRVAGRASGPAHDWHVLRAAVTATIEALGMLLAGRARLALEYAEVVSAGPSKVAVVSLLWLSSTGAERIAGAAPVAGEPPDAAVLATIAAVRGQLPDLLGRPAIES